MTLRIYVNDNNGDRVRDLEDVLFGDVSFGTKINAGYHMATIPIKRQDDFARWDIKPNYSIAIYDGLKRVWYGRIDNLPASFDGTTIEASGYGAALNERQVRKIWVDNAVLDRMRVTDDTKDGQTNRFYVERYPNNRRIRFVSSEANDGRSSTEYHGEYFNVGESRIRKVIYSWIIRTGEGTTIVVRSGTGATEDSFFKSTPFSKENGSRDSGVFTSNSNEFELRIYTTDAQYDEEDWVSISNVKVETFFNTNHANYASPTYNPRQIAEDVLREAGLVGDTISTDLSLNLASTDALSFFGVDDYRTAMALIEDLLSFGDSAYDTYYWFVYDPDGSDGLPRFEVSKYDISTAKYDVELKDRELIDFEASLDHSQISNYVRVKFVNSESEVVYWTPENDANLKDDDSIAAYGRRDSRVLDIGVSNSTIASQVGRRYLNFWKEPQYKGTLKIEHEIRRTGRSVRVPVSWVKAGDTIRVLNLDRIFYITETQLRHSAGKPDILTITPGIPTDTLDVFLSRRDVL